MIHCQHISDEICVECLEWFEPYARVVEAAREWINEWEQPIYKLLSPTDPQMKLYKALLELDKLNKK